MYKLLSYILLVLLILVSLFAFHRTEATEGNFEPLTVKEYAYQRVVEEWGEEEWEYFDDLVTRESNWNTTAQNKRSTAFGTMQFLSNTWATVGCEKTDNGYVQIDCGIKYISARYGTPKKSIIHHNLRNWY